MIFDGTGLDALLRPDDMPRALRGIETLRQAFLTRTTNGAPYLDNPEVLAAFRAYFFPQTFAKTTSVLTELGITATRVLDLGSGNGGAAFAAWARAKNAKLELVDFSDAALRDAMRIASSVGARLSTRKHSLEAGLPPITERYDLVFAANSLSELASIDQRVERARAVIETALTDGGSFVIIEPAHRLHSRDLQTLRDRLLVFGHAPVAPCPHSAACPALVRDRDFCHEARAMTLPAWHEPLRRAVGISDDRTRFSYLVYGGKAPTREPDLLRVISHPLKDKGRLRYLCCGQNGLTELQRQDKHRSDRNAAFDALGRGALLSVPNATARVKIDSDTDLVLRSPSDPFASDEDQNAK